MTNVRRLLATLVAVSLVCAAGVHAGAKPIRTRDLVRPMDYAKIAGLSEPMYENFKVEELHLTMADGVQLYVEITRPVDAGRWPVIAEISPYHGTIYQRDGVRILPEQGGLANYFPARGYAVMMVDVRGTGRSGGCLDLMGPRDQSDAKHVIEWAAKQPWSNGRVGALGHSYPGGTSVMSLAEHPKGLATVVVSAGLGTMYDHQYQAGVPYNLQVIGPYAGYSALTFERHLPTGLPGVGSGAGGDDLGNNTEYIACGLDSAPAIEGAEQLAPLDQLSGRFAPWHAARDFRPGAATAKVPVFVVHGVNDNAARVASIDWLLKRNNPNDKLWLGQWDHGVGCCPNRRGWQWTQALHAWFDKQLQQRDVETGPPFEAFLVDGNFVSVTSTYERTEVLAAKKFNTPSRMLTLYPRADGGLSGAQSEPGSVSFAGNPFGYFDNALTNGAEFATDEVQRGTVLVGMPWMRLAVSLTVPRVYIIGTVFDESPEGDRRRITQFAINPELREGVRKAKVVLPGVMYKMGPPGYAMAHHLRKGHRIVLRFTTSDPDKVPVFSIDPNITIFTGAGNTELRLPVVDDPVLVKDTFQIKPPKSESVSGAESGP
jgi:predicted acyl esterase